VALSLLVGNGDGAWPVAVILESFLSAKINYLYLFCVINCFDILLMFYVILWFFLDQLCSHAWRK